jgi:hypothetical protein
MSYPHDRQLSEFEREVLLKWRLVPEELWSKPNLYGKDRNLIPNKLISAVLNRGIQSLGFTKEKVFNYCHSTLLKRTPVEDAHIDNVCSVIDLLRGHGGEINHYCKESHLLKTFRIDDYTHHGYLPGYSDFHYKLMKRTDRVTFITHETKFKESLRFGGNYWATSNVDFKNLDHYPELDAYLAHSKILNEINMNLSKIAEALPVLFQIGKEQINKITIKPCFISDGQRGFYLHHFSGSSQYGLLLDYEGITTWKI